MQTEAQKRANYAYVRRRKARGMKRVAIWVTPPEEAAIRGFLEALRMQSARQDKAA